MTNKVSTKQFTSRRTIWRPLVATLGLCFLMLLTVTVGTVQTASAHSLTLH